MEETEKEEKPPRTPNPLARFFAHVKAEITAEIVRSLVIALLLVFITWLAVYLNTQLQEQRSLPELDEISPVSK